MPSRSHFVSATLAFGAGLIARPLASGGADARPGPYCLPLRKGAADKTYDFELDVLDGTKPFSLAENLGSPVWLNFFATWCGPCNREMPDVVKMASRYAPLGLRVFAVDVKESPEKARAFRQKYAVPFPILLDAEGSIFRAFGFRGYPTHVFFAANGALTCIANDGLASHEMENEIAVAVARATAPPAPSPNLTATP